MAWGDPSILQEIIRQSRLIADPHASRLFRRAAVETGLVESGGRNLRGGDADSQNWRQERASVYGPAWRKSGGPLNTRASVARFRQEFLQQFDPGERAWQVAAQVQRPRADLRGRYHDVAGEAANVLRSAGGGGGALMDAAGSAVSVPGVQGAQNQPQGSSGLVPLLQALSEQQKRPAASSGLPAPSFAAQPTLAGGQTPVSGGGPVAKPDISALLAAVQTQGGDVALAPGNAGGTIDGTGPGASGGQPAGKVTVAPGANRAGTNINPAVVNFVRGIAGGVGHPLTIGTGTNHSRLTINGTVSDHGSGNAADVPLTGKALIRAGQQALIEAGMPVAQARRQTGGGYNVGGWQIIFNTDAPGWGDHTTHLHVGRRRR